jgi:chromosome segregation ATPase
MDGTYLSIIGTIGVAIYLFAEWRGGRLSGKGLAAQTAADTIEVLQKSVDAFKAELTEANKKHDTQIAAANAEIAKQHDQIIRLEEANKHKDGQIEQYLQIISNRNPELEKVLTDIRAFLTVLNEKIGDGQKINITEEQK